MDPINPNEGKEVVFSSTVGEATRTLYGDETADRDSIRVNWVDGDLISVYGTTCTVPQAEYKVSTTDKDGNVVSGQNYASDLVKTGTTGVQWGSAETSDFYAVYPSVGDNQFTKVDGGVKVQTTVRPKQNVTFAYNSTTKTWVGQHYNGAASNPTMTDAVMYAYTAGATSGKQVDLKFKPFSTVLRFTFKGYKGYQMDGENKIEYTSTVAVNKIVLTAPNTKIAGDFALTIKNDGSAEATQGTSNTIEIYPDYLPMKSNEQLQFDIFTIPTANVMPQDAEQAWKVQVVTEKGTFTFNLVPKTVTTPDSASVPGLALTTGALHKLTIPLKTVTFDFDIPANNWIRYIPRNVYLSELSLPGAWYCYDGNYQSDTNLANLYAKGVRAFHIDCRMSPSSYDNGFLGYGATWGPLQLVCAGTDKWSTGGSVFGTLTPGTTVLSALTTIASQITSEEFVMVVLTVAEKPLTSSGNAGGGATIDPATVLAGIKSVLDTNATALKLYTDKITSATTVKDVLGKMVVKVNANAQESYEAGGGFTTYTNVPSTLISAAAMTSDTDWISGDIFGSAGDHAMANLFTEMQTEPMYWGKDATDMEYHYHQAQLTLSTDDSSTTPSYDDRKAAIDDIIAKSADIYATNLHNALFQLGIGGYIDDSGENRKAVASTLNPYVLDKVNEKLASSPSPIGIVLMNFCTDATYKGPELVNAILEMNTKFYLNRDHDADYGEWPDGNPFETSGGSGVVEENPDV